MRPAASDLLNLARAQEVFLRGGTSCAAAVVVLRAQFFSGRTSANMPPVPVLRSRRARVPSRRIHAGHPPSSTSSTSPLISAGNLWCVVLFLTFVKVAVNADCWYESERYAEGAPVLTNEPCLNCTCSKGALLCYLRVCPRLPNPPPPGCIILHRYKACCAELICSDIPSGNGIEARSEIDDELFELDREQMKNACVHNGSVYAPGSAMDSSSSCEFCYCIGGEQKCVRPKCLLPLDGCLPAYDADDCCPARYNCTRDLFTTTSTTTLAPREYEAQGGCVVDGSFYPEGGKVLGIGHSACDNCYCLRSLVRCEPLSCATPLLGCTPVIRPGECCAASYNCSGAIETQPEPHYGQFPTVSKEYAKLHKQVQQHKRTTPRTERPLSKINNIPYYVIAESTKLKDSNSEEQKYPTTRSYLNLNRPKEGASINSTIRFITHSPFYYSLTNKTQDKQVNRIVNDRTPEIYYVPTKVAGAVSNPDIYREDSLATTIRHKKYTTSSEVKQIKNVLEERIIRGIINRTRDEDFTDLEVKTESVAEETSTETTEDTNGSEEKIDGQETPADDRIDTEEGHKTEHDSGTEMSTTDNDLSSTTIEITTSFDGADDITSTPFYEPIELITVRTVVNSTDCNTNQDQDNTSKNHLLNNTSSQEAILNLSNDSRHNAYQNMETTTEQFVSTTEPFDFTTEMSNDVITEFTTMADSTEQATTMETPNIVETIPPKVKIALQNILNVNKSLDYDYDYTAPTLPPSLPNLRIIPFVAADAVESKTDDQKSPSYIEDKTFPFSNKFSPPSETEGGFVPKEPPIEMIDRFYDDYHTTNVNGVSSMPVIPSLTNPPKTDENNCMIDTKEIKHGESVTSEGNCALCVCFYRSIVCHEPQCALPQNGCRNSNKVDRSTCCPEIVCDVDESPTVVLNRVNNTNATVAEPVTPADPFKDVIRTEPAPDLQLLIGDMSNYLLKKSTTTTTTSSPPLSSTTEHSNTNDSQSSGEDDKDLSFNKIWDMLFNLEETTTQSTTTTTSIMQSTSSTKSAYDRHGEVKTDLHQSNQHNYLETRENVDNNLGLAWASSIASTKRQEYVPGLLKLAGCNIYGRMYRVGRIISELSGPCMECKCTEIGVQCENLTC